jgi:hydroxylamine reductase (hybrid-cluster protein)
VIPRGVDREVVEALHRTHIGDDQDPAHILNHAIRTSLADGWAGSMIATDISDILFGTPAPILGQANLGVIKDDMVNVVVHGHEPSMSEMLVAASQDPEIIEYAKAAGAHGVQLSGICCTGYPCGGKFPPSRVVHHDWRGRSDGRGCAVHYASIGGIGSKLPHENHYHVAEGQNQGRDAYRVR